MNGRDLEHSRRNVLYGALLCLAGLLINIGGSKLALVLKLPVFLDSIGTILAAALGGVIPGIAVGFLTNVIGGISDYATAYYGVLNVLIALAQQGSSAGECSDGPAASSSPSSLLH